MLMPYGTAVGLMFVPEWYPRAFVFTVIGASANFGRFGAEARGLL